MLIGKMLRSKFCWIVMTIGIILSIILIKNNFSYLKTNVLAAVPVVLFIILFSISLGCTVMITKERIKTSRQVDKKSWLNVVLYIVGFTTLQTCFLSGVCGVNLVISFLAIFLPWAIIDFMMYFGIYIIIVIDIILMYSIYNMKCFRGKK